MNSLLNRSVFYGLIACAAVWVAWMAADNVHPYDYDAAASHMVPDPIQQNASIPNPMITSDWALAHVNKVCPGTVQRFFRNMETGQIVSTLDTTPLSRSVRDGDRHLPRSFPLPPKLPLRVGYSALICSECNLFQHLIRPLCFMTPEIEFRVIP
jgi:hypothetical protein